MSYKGQETDAFGNIPPPKKKVLIFKKVSKNQKSIIFKIIQDSKVYKLKHHNFFSFLRIILIFTCQGTCQYKS